jgi:hypothetical protein
MTTTTPTTIRTRTSQWLAAARSGSCYLVAAGAIAVGAMTLTAPAANAAPQTEAQIKTGCKDANGGTYTNHGGGYSTCTYKDSKGNKYTDDYIDGEYQGTTQAVQGTPSSKPAPPSQPPVQNPGRSPQQ